METRTEFKDGDMISEEKINSLVNERDVATKNALAAEALVKDLRVQLANTKVNLADYKSKYETVDGILDDVLEKLVDKN